MPTTVITGGATGIGRATAEVLHACGHQVAVTGQNPESVARAQSELPGDVLVVRSDGRVLSDTDARCRRCRWCRRGSDRWIRVNAVSPGATGTPLLNITGQDITVAGGYGLGA
ncbi:SDR family NAD(P)-dependent oxidoreductase [Streptomyces sp. NPDC052292]|uniref:SDR family NAD(P)-dependent oxidoreductase n=1 Tax=Streptomyces sp. NPDC052292 TaxID=3155053 RepID=UPI003447F139